jgi:hypothetical protein
MAVVVVPYILLMVGLGAWIWRSGQPRGNDQPGGEEDGRDDPGPDALPIAA